MPIGALQVTLCMCPLLRREVSALRSMFDAVEEEIKELKKAASKQHAEGARPVAQIHHDNCSP